MKELKTSPVPGAVTVSPGARKLIKNSTADSTRRAYKTALRAVDAFAGGQPLTDATVADYLAQRHEEGKSPATLRMTIAAINFRYKLQQAPSPVGALAKRALAGAARQGAGRGRGQAHGIDFAQADHMAAVAAKNGKKLSGLRDCALILITSDALLRVGETAALSVGDICTGDATTGKGATVTITRSKTDQTGEEGATLYLRPRTAFSIRQYLQHAGITEGPLFRPVHRKQRVQRRALSPRAVRRIICRCASDAGVGEGGRISGHSLRVGAAGDLAMRGASLPELQTAGRWKSSAQAVHYAKAGLASHGVVSRLRPK